MNMYFMNELNNQIIH